MSDDVAAARAAEERAELIELLRDVVASDRATIAELSAMCIDVPPSVRILSDRAAALLAKIEGGTR